jgi:hypothetical protein
VLGGGRGSGTPGRGRGRAGARRPRVGKPRSRLPHPSPPLWSPAGRRCGGRGASYRDPCAPRLPVRRTDCKAGQPPGKVGGETPPPPRPLGREEPVRREPSRSGARTSRAVQEKTAAASGQSQGARGSEPATSSGRRRSPAPPLPRSLTSLRRPREPGVIHTSQPRTVRQPRPPPP